jgi:transposase-like protein
MIEPKKRKQFLIQDRRNILAQVNVSKETRVALCSRLGIVPSTLNTTVKNRKDTKKCYTNCGRLCGQRKSPKQSPIKEVASLLSVWLKEVRASNAIISDSVLREKALCIPRMFGIEPLMAGLIVSNSDTLLCT